MQNNNNEKLNNTNSKEANYVLFDLNLKATKIKNCYLIKDCINALSDFVSGKTIPTKSC